MVDGRAWEPPRTGPGRQLPLNLALRDDATLANYYTGDNLELVQCLAADHDVRAVYLWGGPAAGKTHLLQALCHQAGRADRSCAYLPLGEADGLSPTLLEGLERLDTVCIDDLQAVAGRREWEEELFHLFNRCRDARARLVVGAAAGPAGLGLILPDLVSRLKGALVFHVKGLSDAQMMEALQLRAHRRGLELPAEVARYLLRHYRRDMSSLAALLERLDRASLAAQRRLTIPFVRQWL